MKKIVFVLVLTLVLPHLPKSQINIGSKLMVNIVFGSGKFKKHSLKQLKESKTVFLCRDDDDVDKLQKALEEVWTYTKGITVVPYSQANSINSTNRSFFSIGGLNTIQQMSNMNNNHVHLYLNLWMYKNPKKKKRKLSYCRIELFPSGKDIEDLIAEDDEEITNMYNRGNIKNWTTGFLRVYLKYTNTMLQKEERRLLFSGISDNKDLAQLKTEVLYVPEYVFEKMNSRTGDESERFDKNSIFASYPYKYEVISSDTLSDKIITSEEPVYYLVYIRSSTDIYISVFNSESGEMIYSSYSPVRYNIADGDIKNLTKTIKRSN